MLKNFSTFNRSELPQSTQQEDKKFQVRGEVSHYKNPRQEIDRSLNTSQEASSTQTYSRFYQDKSKSTIPPSTLNSDSHLKPMMNDHYRAERAPGIVSSDNQQIDRPYSYQTRSNLYRNSKINEAKYSRPKEVSRAPEDSFSLTSKSDIHNNRNIANKSQSKENHHANSGLARLEQSYGIRQTQHNQERTPAIEPLRQKNYINSMYAESLDESTISKTQEGVPIRKKPSSYKNEDFQFRFILPQKDGNFSKNYPGN